MHVRVWLARKQSEITSNMEDFTKPLLSESSGLCKEGAHIWVRSARWADPCATHLTRKKEMKNSRMQRCIIFQHNTKTADSWEISWTLDHRLCWLFWFIPYFPLCFAASYIPRLGKDTRLKSKEIKRHVTERPLTSNVTNFKCWDFGCVCCRQNDFK